MKVKIEIDENELKKMLIEKFESMFNDTNFDASKLVIEVKSTQNYKSEWEPAAFRARYEGDVK
jgi:hypothetical protein